MAECDAEIRVAIKRHETAVLWQDPEGAGNALVSAATRALTLLLISDFLARVFGVKSFHAVSPNPEPEFTHKEAASIVANTTPAAVGAIVLCLHTCTKVVFGIF